MRPTIRMIANIAGVSRGTVDRVINNRSYVDDDKRKRILKVMKDLNYTPNLAGRALAFNKKSVKLGVVFPGWSGHFEKELIDGIEAARAEFAMYGVSILVERCESKLPAEFVEKLDRLVAEGAKGLSVCAINSPSVRDKLRKITDSGIPVVTFNSDVLDSGRCCFVGQDREKGGRLAGYLMRRMIPQSARVLIVAGIFEFNSHRDRVKGFCDSLRESGRKAEVEIIQTFNEYDITFEKVTAEFAKRGDFQAIYMANESVPGCVDALKEMRLPERLPMVAHDLSPINKTLLQQGYVDYIIDQNMHVQGFRPLEILAELLGNNKPVESELDYTTITIFTPENLGP